MTHTAKKDIWISLFYFNGDPAFDDAPELGASPHAMDAMTKLGISYKEAVPFSTLDGWRFFDCEGIPDQLPGWASVYEHKGFFGS